MNEVLAALPWVLTANLWLACGCAIVLLALARGVVAPPSSLVHSIILMGVWPVLVLKGAMALLASPLRNGGGPRRT